ncbi:hypothetical protein [Isoptericola haloaureus]|uniref:Xaa-Pro dipeptidyl-peptidase C-terminal domain-containing protein n=1 Tax=Isoptericola haloaureus TaxID=1542902 RepID=A0ABU7Z4L7_9MICO
MDRPVTLSELEGYPARGNLVDSGDWAAEAEAAADVWRAEPTGGREEPPSDAQPISLLWAGDLPAGMLMGHLRYEFALDVPERPDLLETARAVVLRAGDRTALLIAKLEDDGARDDDFTVVGDGIAPSLDGAALHPGEGVFLLAANSDGSSGAGPAEIEVVSASTGSPVGERPVHDGLLVSAPFDALRAPATGATPERLVTSTGTTIETDGTGLWEALTGPDAPSTWSALADAEQAARKRAPGTPVRAEVWGAESLDDGRSVAVVGAQVQPDDTDDAWWAVTAAVLAPGDGDPWVGDPWVYPLGRGPAASTADGTALPPLAADWVVRDAEELTVDLIVAASPQVAQVAVETRGRTIELDAGLSVLPSWEDDGEWPAPSPVVLVGRAADGTPLAPLPH